MKRCLHDYNYIFFNKSRQTIIFGTCIWKL